MYQHNIQKYIVTSAKTGEGVQELIDDIIINIPWDRLPRTTTPWLFQNIRQFLLRSKEESRVLLTYEEILHEIKKCYAINDIQIDEVKTVVCLLQSRGLVFNLKPTQKTDLVFLKPEMINNYAASIIQAARNHPKGIGAVPERDVLTASIYFNDNFIRLEQNTEKTVLASTVELLIRHDLCFREMGFLVFPSQIIISRPILCKQHHCPEAVYRFSGNIGTIYATLVVRLSHTSHFKLEERWKYSAEFSRDGYLLGFSILNVEEGTCDIEIYFSQEISKIDRVVFVHFIIDHLKSKGVDVKERFIILCPKCRQVVKDELAIQHRLNLGESDIPCQFCGTCIPIEAIVEEQYSNSFYDDKQRQLEKIALKSTKKDIHDFQIWSRPVYQRKRKENIRYILHLSDIHISNHKQVYKFLNPLETDLKKNLNIRRLDYLVISGDIVNSSISKEYDAALEMLEKIVSHFALDSDRIVIVPGNHDLNWDISDDSYDYISMRKNSSELLKENCIPAGNAGVLYRNAERYKKRFSNFNKYFYKKIYKGQEYPTDYNEQGLLYFCKEDEIVFLALNSSWEIDHYHSKRAGIHENALNRALDNLMDTTYDTWLKIAVCHHPVTGPGMMNDEFLEVLASHDFHIYMHGHIHQTKESFYKYDSQNGIHIIGAGTFGAPVTGQVPGIPLQYNLLKYDKNAMSVIVETRKKEKPNGSWSADARWGDISNNPEPRYLIKIT